MACQSVAVSKAVISQIILDLDTLKGALGKLLGVDVGNLRAFTRNEGESIIDHRGKKKIVKDTYSYAVDGSKYANLTVALTQRVEEGKPTIRLQLTSQGATQRELDKLQSQLEPQLDKLLVVAQQSAVLKRLAQLGKLSNVQQKDSGVTARVEITL